MSKSSRGRAIRKGAKVEPKARDKTEPDGATVAGPAWGAEGLLPAIVQDPRSGEVLMAAWMNREALDKTLETGRVHFWSRSRNALWRKGETSGNELLFRRVDLDCDGDTLLVQAEPTGPVCHTGHKRCFFRTHTPGGWEERPEAAGLPGSGEVLNRIYETILDRKYHPRPDSYVTRLFSGGVDRILKKVSEEAGELVIGSKNGDTREVVSEMADLCFHLLVVLGHHEIAPAEVFRELESRIGKPHGRPKD